MIVNGILRLIQRMVSFRLILIVKYHCENKFVGFSGKARNSLEMVLGQIEKCSIKIIIIESLIQENNSPQTRTKRKRTFRKEVIDVSSFFIVFFPRGDRTDSVIVECRERACLKEN